ncbi:MAG: MAPEG family protein, partial [Gammaproteobacteria bacterium]
PVLFYVGVIVAYLTGQTGGLMTTIAWMYVVTRITHSWIHMTSNVVLWRFRVFISSWIVLLSMWTLICIGLLRAT